GQFGGASQPDERRVADRLDRVSADAHRPILARSGKSRRNAPATGPGRELARISPAFPGLALRSQAYDGFRRRGQWLSSSQEGSVMGTIMEKRTAARPGGFLPRLTRAADEIASCIKRQPDITLGEIGAALVGSGFTWSPEGKLAYKPTQIALIEEIEGLI